VGLPTTLVSAALVASSVNSLLTTISLLTQLNEKMKLMRNLTAATKALTTVVEKMPHVKGHSAGAMNESARAA